MIFDRERLKNDMYEFLEDPEIENKYSKFYVDSVGKITIGVGHMIPTKEDFLELLPYFHKIGSPSVRATPKMMEDEWKRLAKLKANYKGLYKETGPHTYTKDALIEMDDSQIKIDAKDKIDEKINDMTSYYKTIFNAPYPAQLALLDMIYNVGLPKMKKNFKSFNEAINNGHWLIAAKESHRKGIREIRNKKIAAFFRSAAIATTRNDAQMCIPFPNSELFSMNDESPFPHSLRPGQSFQYPQTFYLNPKDYLSNENQSKIDPNEIFQEILKQ